VKSRNKDKICLESHLENVDFDRLHATCAKTNENKLVNMLHVLVS